MQRTHFDLHDRTLIFRADVLDDPTPLYAQLRAHAPVWEIPGSATFLVTSAELLIEAVGRTDDFSSNLTSLIYRGGDGGPAVFDMGPLGDATHVLATADPPVHTAHRRLLQQHLAPKSVARLERDIASITDELLDPVVARGGGDFIGEFADLLPMRVISRAIGLPAADTPRLVQLVLDVDQILAGVSDTEAMGRAAESAMEQATYLAEHLTRVIAKAGDDRRASDAPADDMLELLASAVQDQSVTFAEAVGILVQMLGAGSETTTSLLGSAVRVLSIDTELQDQLRARPEGIATFLEEVLRVDGPFRFHYRSVPHDTYLGGVAIPSGARVLLMWGAANLDDRAYPEPARINLDRPIPKSHLAFGRGLHFCIGAPLARLETRIALERLLARTRAVTLDPARPPRLHPDIFLRRLSQLGIRVES